MACGNETTGGGVWLSPTQFTLLSGSGQTGPVGIALAAPLVAEVRATDSTVIPGFRVDFRVSSGSATLDPSTTHTDGLGRASTLVTPTAPGNIVVSATVYSSSLTDDFLLSASGTSPDPCIAGELTPVIAQVVKTLGGSGVCLGGDANGADYTLIAFNADTSVANSAEIRVTGNGLGPPPAGAVVAAAAAHRQPQAPRTMSVAPAAANPAGLAVRMDAARRWRDATSRRSSIVADSVGQRRLVNVNFANDCAAPVMRVGRVAAVSGTSVLVVDSLAPPGALSAADLNWLQSVFDSLSEPSVRLNFREPFDMDSNTATVLFLTGAVNALSAPPAFGAPDVVFRSRDLFPLAAGDSLPAPCAASNAAELLYLAIPDPTGSLGPPRTVTELRTRWPRILAHEYQHLVNASRRLYVVGATTFEAPWLDEALSQVAEELVFLRMASRNTRENFGALDLGLTVQSLDAIAVAQQVNLDNYRAYLTNVSATSPLSSVTNPAGRGAAWALLRYLVGHAPPPDYNSLTALGSSRRAGLDNLRSVFGPTLPLQIRNWTTAAFTDDLFATEPALQEPTWSFRSVYPDLQGTPFPLATTPLVSAVPSNVTIAALTAAYFRLSVPAGGQSSLTWGAPTAGPIAPTVRWTLVRTR
jgi:hypothetical protein